MGLAFYILVSIGFVLLWFILAFLFKPVGQFFYRLWSDVEDAINDDDNTEQKE